MAAGGLMPALQAAWTIPQYLIMLGLMGDALEMRRRWMQETKPEKYQRSGWAGGAPGAIVDTGIRDALRDSAYQAQLRDLPPLAPYGGLGL